MRDQVMGIMQGLRDQVEDAGLSEAGKQEAALRRSLLNLGADEATIKKAIELQRQASQATDQEQELEQQRASFTGQGGTFSSLASLAIGAGDDTQKQIKDASVETARNTRKIAKDGGMSFGA
jgi:hypothetical protein